MTNIKVLDLIGPYCVIPEDGERLCVRIAAELNRGEVVELDFGGVTDLISAFLNPAIGCLYGKFPKETIANRVRWTGLDETDAEVMRIVQERAVRFFESEEPGRAALRSASMNPAEA